MKKLILSTITFFIYLNVSYSQEANNKKWKLSNAQLGIFTMYDDYRGLDFDQLKTNAKDQNDFANYDLTTFSVYDGYGLTSGLINFSVGLNHFKTEDDYWDDKAKKTSGLNKELRLGVVYFRNRGAYFSFYKETALKPDSVLHQSIEYREIIDELAIESSYIIYTNNPVKRLRLYIGFGVGTGFSVFSSIREEKYEYTSVNVLIGNQNYNIYLNDRQSSIKYINSKAVYNLRFFMPLGLSLRLNKKTDLLVESRLGLSYQQVIKGKGYLRNQSGIGVILKYKW